jgi:HlyD family secretion protein
MFERRSEHLSHLRGAAALALAVCALGGCAKKEEAEAERAVPVQVAAVRQEPIRRTVQADAVVYPVDQAAIAPKVSAPVAKFFVNRGDHVKVGQLLATLEDRDLNAALAESKGQLAQAEAGYQNVSAASIPEDLAKAEADVRADTEQFNAAERLLQSRQDLFKQGALARRQVEEAQVQHAQAKSQLDAAQEHLRIIRGVGRQAQTESASAQVAAAKAHVQAAEAQLGYAQIHSPISGVVSERPLYAGETAASGAPLITVVNVSEIVARANIPSEQASALKVGDAATITATQLGLTLPGKVTVVSPATDPGATTLQVWVQAANPGERLKPGASVRVSIVAETIPAATVVPAAAILPGPEGGTAVAVVGSDSVAHLKTVVIGVRESDKAQILSGVAPGENVVVSGGVGLEDKAKVKLSKPGDKSEESGEKDEE